VEGDFHIDRVTDIMDVITFRDSEGFWRQDWEEAPRELWQARQSYYGLVKPNARGGAFQLKVKNAETQTDAEVPLTEPGIGKSSRYGRIDRCHFKQGDIVRFRIPEESRDLNPPIYLDSKRVVEEEGRLNLGEEIAGYVKTRFGIVVEIHPGKGLLTIAPMYTHGAKGLRNMNEDRRRPCVNIRYEQDGSYVRQNDMIREDWTLVIRASPFYRWRPDPTSVVRLDTIFTKHMDDRMEKMTELRPESLVKLLILWASYRRFVALGNRPLNPKELAVLDQGPWLGVKEVSVRGETDPNSEGNHNSPREEGPKDRSYRDTSPPTTSRGGAHKDVTSYRGCRRDRSFSYRKEPYEAVTRSAQPPTSHDHSSSRDGATARAPKGPRGQGGRGRP
jgi:hypothetical protein